MYGKTPQNVKSYLTLEQLDQLSFAELSFISLKGLHNLKALFADFLATNHILDFWKDLDVSDRCALEWKEETFFKTFISLSLIFDGADDCLIVYYFKIHLKEVHRWQSSDQKPADKSPSAIARLLSYFIDPLI